MRVLFDGTMNEAKEQSTILLMSAKWCHMEKPLAEMQAVFLWAAFPRAPAADRKKEKIFFKIMPKQPKTRPVAALWLPDDCRGLATIAAKAHSAPAFTTEILEQWRIVTKEKGIAAARGERPAGGGAFECFRQLVLPPCKNEITQAARSKKYSFQNTQKTWFFIWIF